jgi:inhibitor of cysteine peptidase
MLWNGSISAKEPAREKSIGWVVLCALLGAICVFPAAWAENKVVTDADKGSTVHLKAGDTLEVRLKANPSTGYQWQVHAKSTPLLKLVHQSHIASQEPGVGRPGLQVFDFEAQEKGQGGLLLHYVRPWEKSAQDARRFEMQVVIE